MSYSSLSFLVTVTVWSGCAFSPATTDDDPEPPPEPAPCASGKAGAPCVLALYDRAASCDREAVEQFTRELAAHRDDVPLWSAGRALLATDRPLAIAGTFNDWSPTSHLTTALCGAGLPVAVIPVVSGAHAYKLVDGDRWQLDPHNPAFVYDDFAGNPDQRNSALVTHDAGRGYTIELPPACSATLDNCRELIAYLPPGYDAPERARDSYPVLFMHDGQNVWDDSDCCFGHTGWEINRALDREIAAGTTRPMVVIAAAHSSARNSEYGLDPAVTARFMAFQTDELQPAALARVRWNGKRVAVAGSSLGGLVAIELALARPDVYAVGVALSGAFWPGGGNGTSLRDRLATIGKQPVALYLDHGGRVADNSDGAADTVALRDSLVSLGWQSTPSPECTVGDRALCYHHEPDATHDELAWRDRAWRFLRFVGTSGQ